VCNLKPNRYRQSGPRRISHCGSFGLGPRGPFLGARALLLLTEVGPKPAPNEPLLAEAFGLSPAEVRLATRLTTGASLETVSAERGVALITVRNQLKSIFAKTDTHRQSELIALLSRL
jgi:DNA-binding CsgD family transcriptional regulator